MAFSSTTEQTTVTTHDMLSVQSHMASLHDSLLRCDVILLPPPRPAGEALHDVVAIASVLRSVSSPYVYVAMQQQLELRGIISACWGRLLRPQSKVSVIRSARPGRAGNPLRIVHSRRRPSPRQTASRLAVRAARVPATGCAILRNHSSAQLPWLMPCPPPVNSAAVA